MNTQTSSNRVRLLSFVFGALLVTGAGMSLASSSMNSLDAAAVKCKPTVTCAKTWTACTNNIQKKDCTYVSCKAGDKPETKTMQRSCGKSSAKAKPASKPTKIAGCKPKLTCTKWTACANKIQTKSCVATTCVAGTPTKNTTKQRACGGSSSSRRASSSSKK
jgi:hypothetical protein